MEAKYIPVKTGGAQLQLCSFDPAPKYANALAVTSAVGVGIVGGAGWFVAPQKLYIVKIILQGLNDSCLK